MSHKMKSSPRISDEASLLVGSLVECGLPLQDESGSVGLLFSFSNLSIRCAGPFCLRFSLLNLRATGSVSNNDLVSSTCAIHHIFSQKFFVYTPRFVPSHSQRIPWNDGFELVDQVPAESRSSCSYTERQGSVLIEYRHLSFFV